MELVGTVEILRQRIYNLDPEASGPNVTEVVVEPGTFPLYSDGLSYYWSMTGRINARGFHRLGDGLFVLQMNDEGSGAEVTFPSHTYGTDEWQALLDEPVCQEGNPEQRLRIRLTTTKENQSS